ncbi:MAG TPA: hypothetical protein VIU46_03145, partial [Gallionellaceae bacterium]
MDEVKVQSLMAPTWIERSRADDQFFFSLGEQHDDLNPCAEDILQAIGEAQPSPAEFLSALVAFWAEVSLQQHNYSMSQFGSRKRAEIDAGLAARLASAHANKFSMTPAKPPVSESVMRGWGAWKLVAGLGRFVPLVEPQLLACLEHPVSTVQDAAARAFGTADTISDEVFRQYLAFADRCGGSGFVWVRTGTLAKHMTDARIARLLDGLVPGAPEAVLQSRLGIIEGLQGTPAQTACRYLLDHLGDAWADAQLSKVIYTLVRLGQTLGMPEEAVPRMEALAGHANDDVRTEAVWFLANHSPRAHQALLLEKMDDPYPRVLDAICNGFARHDDVPPDLLRRAAARTLGNYEGHDGEPHYSAVTMVTASPAHARTALPEIIAWWEHASASAWLDQTQIRHALDIAERLGAEAAALKPGLERALAWLTKPDEDEEELPEIGEPGAIPVIQQKLEEGMREAGNPPVVVEAASEFYGGLLNYIADNTQDWQK